MARILLLCFCSALCATSQVFGGTEYRLGKNGNDWQAALTEASVYQVFDADGHAIHEGELIARRVPSACFIGGGAGCLRINNFPSHHVFFDGMNLFEAAFKVIPRCV